MLVQRVVVHAEPAIAEPTGAWLTAKEAATRLKVSRSTVSRLASEGTLEPTRKVGTRLQVHVDACDAFERSLPSAKKDMREIERTKRSPGALRWL